MWETAVYQCEIIRKVMLSGGGKECSVKQSYDFICIHHECRFPNLVFNSIGSHPAPPMTDALCQILCKILSDLSVRPLPRLRFLSSQLHTL